LRLANLAERLPAVSHPLNSNRTGRALFLCRKFARSTARPCGAMSSTPVPPDRRRAACSPWQGLNSARSRTRRSSCSLARSRPNMPRPQGSLRPASLPLFHGARTHPPLDGGRLLSFVVTGNACRASSAVLAGSSKEIRLSADHRRSPAGGSSGSFQRGSGSRSFNVAMILPAPGEFKSSLSNP
jgi:hypothetical protein